MDEIMKESRELLELVKIMREINDIDYSRIMSRVVNVKFRYLEELINSLDIKN